MIDYKRCLRAAVVAQSLRGYAASVGEITNYIHNNGEWATQAEVEKMIETLVKRGELVHSFAGRYVVHTDHRERALKGVTPQRENRDHIDSHRTHAMKMQVGANKLAAEYHKRRAARAKLGDGTVENPIISSEAGKRPIRPKPTKKKKAPKKRKSQ